MAHLGISSMEELLNQCINSSPKELMREALDCYNMGSYRSSLISIWHAICFDFYIKLYDLKNEGNADAIAIVGDLEKAKQKSNQDTPVFFEIQEFERNIAEKYLKDLLGLSVFEAGEIRQLYYDRHKSAHPALYDGEVVKVTPEKVRMHFAQAVKFVLSIQRYFHKEAANYKSEVEHFLQSDYIDSLRLIENNIKNRFIFIRESAVKGCIGDLIFNIGISSYLQYELQYIKFSFLIKELHEKYKDKYNEVVNKNFEKLIFGTPNKSVQEEDVLLRLSSTCYAELNKENIDFAKMAILGNNEGGEENHKTKKLGIKSFNKFIHCEHIEENYPDLFNLILEEVVNSLKSMKESAKTKKSTSKINNFIENLPKSIIKNNLYIDCIVDLYTHLDGVTFYPLQHFYHTAIEPMLEFLTQDQFEKMLDKILQNENNNKEYYTYSGNPINKEIFTYYDNKFNSKYSNNEKNTIIFSRL